MLPILPAIKAAPIANNELLYPWDEWNVSASYETGEAPAPWVGSMATVSHRGNGALCIAIAEWIVHRFHLVSDDPFPSAYLEACWAGNVHTGYCEYFELVDDQWRGIVRGPLNIAITLVVDCLWGYDDRPLGTQAEWLSNLAILVLPDKTAFEAWRAIVVQRLEEHYPVPEDDEDDLFEDNPMLGDAPPRELFDTSTPFDRSQAAAQQDRFLSGLSPEQGHFLQPAERVEAYRDFDGPAYRYSE